MICIKFAEVQPSTTSVRVRGCCCLDAADRGAGRLPSRSWLTDTQPRWPRSLGHARRADLRPQHFSCSLPHSPRCPPGIGDVAAGSSVRRPSVAIATLPVQANSKSRLLRTNSLIEVLVAGVHLKLALPLDARTASSGFDVGGVGLSRPRSQTRSAPAHKVRRNGDARRVGVIAIGSVEHVAGWRDKRDQRRAVALLIRLAADPHGACNRAGGRTVGLPGFAGPSPVVLPAKAHRFAATLIEGDGRVVVAM